MYIYAKQFTTYAGYASHERNEGVKVCSSGPLLAQLPDSQANNYNNN